MSDFSVVEQQQLLENRTVNASRSYAEQVFHKLSMEVWNKSFHKNAPPVELIQHLSLAIQRAYQGKMEEKHWTVDDFCTRLHVLVQRIFRAEPPDFHI